MHQFIQQGEQCHDMLILVRDIGLTLAVKSADVRLSIERERQPLILEQTTQRSKC